MLLTIFSGGQTGVDRAALDFALERGHPCGGWCPAGRKAEDGRLDEKYPLQETESDGYRQRTKRNILKSDGTLILNTGELTGGTLATEAMAKRYGKPILVVQLDGESVEFLAMHISSWLECNGIQILNIAGPREGKRPGIYDLAQTFLRKHF